MKIFDWQVTFRPLRIILVVLTMTAMWLPVNRTDSAEFRVDVVEPESSLHELEVERIKNEIEPRLTKLTSEESLEVAVALVQECARTGVDPLFVIALIEVESRFDVEAQSPTGARGLMQLIPKTFRMFSDAKRFLDPVENVRAGIRYVHHLVSHGFRRPESVLLAYNQGPGTALAVQRDEQEMPEEGAVFVPKVMSHYKKLLKKHGHKPADAPKLFVRRK
jgi:soluble lytic murein transglycosylase-like protein